MKLLVTVWAVVVVVIFYEVLFRGFVALPGDALVGSKYPWLDYKWGYTTGVPVKNPGISDSYSQLYLWRQEAADNLRSFTWPLLTSTIFSGSPLLATYQSAVLFPANILLVILPKFWGWNIFVIGSTFFAGLSMMLFLNSFAKTRTGIFLGGAVYALGGFMTTTTELGTHVWAMGCLPLIMLSIDRIVLQKNNKYFFVIPILVAILILAGSMQVLVFGMVLAGLYAVFRTIKWKILAKILLAVLLGAGIAAVQIIPTLDVYKNSIRNEENYALRSNFGLSEMPLLIRLWSADFFGHPSTQNDWSGLDYIEYSSFLGTITVVLVLSSLVLIKIPEVRFFSITLGILLILVYNNPISRWVFSLPIPLLTNSLASRLFFIVGLLASVLVAFVIEKIENPKLIRIVPVISIFLLVISWMWWKFVAPPEFQSISLRNLLWPSLLLVVTAVSCLFSPKRKYILPAVFVILTLVDLGRYFRKFNPYMPSNLIFPSTPITEFLSKNSSGYRILNSSDLVLPPNTWSAYGLESIEGYDPLHSLSYSRMIHVANNQDYFNSPSRVMDITGLNIKFLQTLNVKYIISAKDDGIALGENNGLTKVFQDRETSVWENQGVKERLFFAKSYKVKSTESDLAKELMDLNFNPTHTVILAGDPGINIEKTEDATIDNVNLSSQEVNFQTGVPSPQLLVFSQNYDKGWKAFANNQPTTVHRADGGLMAVAVPTGTVNWKLIYLPDSFVQGKLISSISMIILVIGIILHRSRLGILNKK
jgi:hypothetical protein